MELRVWVDGAQRVVCGVKLTTTCQEIVFALAHATQQAGRFTMIERWRNNERLLSPNEQPLVTLQRWGDRMNEVEFILRKTSTDPLPPSQAQQQQQPCTTNSLQTQQSINNGASNQHSSIQQTTSSSRTNVNPTSLLAKQSSQQLDKEQLVRQQATVNGNQDSPAPSHMTNQPAAQFAQHMMTDQAHDNLYQQQQQQQRQFNLSRRPQTSLGPLTSSNSALNLTSNAISHQHTINRLTNAFKPSMSASALPVEPSNGGTPSQPISMMRSRFLEDKSDSPSLYNGGKPLNGYQFQNEAVRFQPTNTNQMSKNYPYDDLYGTINKVRTTHPPAVPAKPRLVNNISHPQQQQQQQQQPMNNAQMNFYNPGQSPIQMFPMNMRPRHPPGYMEYLEAMANRNSLPASLVSNPNLMHQGQSMHGNMYPRSSFDLHNHQLYNIQQQHHQQNGSSPAHASNGSGGQYYYHTNQQMNRLNFGIASDVSQISASMQSQTNPKLLESGLIINRGSAVNIKLPSNSQYVGQNQSSYMEEQKLDNSIQSNTSSVSQMGLDMLKVIEEQKKVLLNQKSELDKLDHDQEYLEAKQSSEQAELINRIEREIAQLETLWRENQIQIRKLENQDFEKELDLLKAEQRRMEDEMDSQRIKLSKLDSDIARCQIKIQQLESELESSEIDAQAEREDWPKNKVNSSENLTEVRAGESPNLNLKPNNPPKTNGSIAVSDNHTSSDSDGEDDSEASASDDVGKSSNSKLRSAKDVAYVDKRGLISGLRALKLDKSRALNRSNEKINACDTSSGLKLTSSSPTTNHLILKDRSSESSTSNSAESTTGTSNGIQELTTVVTNGQNDKKTTASSNSNNNNHKTDDKYEFLMTI